MDVDLRSAVSMSHLRELPAEVLDELLAGSTRMKIAAGSVTHWEGEPDPLYYLRDELSANPSLPPYSDAR